uniref:Uncharacterized protein n=1 Tax=Glossina pallidipes TaxID=7398 RepID=A0A1A9ZU50_GLOPL
MSGSWAGVDFKRSHTKRTFILYCCIYRCGDEVLCLGIFKPLEDFWRKRIQGAADICTSYHIQQLFTSFLFKLTAVSTQLGHLAEPDNARNCKILIYLSCDPSICRYDKVSWSAGRSPCVRSISSGKISIGIVPAIPDSFGLTTLRRDIVAKFRYTDFTTLDERGRNLLLAIILFLATFDLPDI